VATYLVILMQIKMPVNASPACTKNVTVSLLHNVDSSTFECLGACNKTRCIRFVEFGS
jgi:hypothetical protein